MPLMVVLSPSELLHFLRASLILQLQSSNVLLPASCFLNDVLPCLMRSLVLVATSAWQPHNALSWLCHEVQEFLKRISADSKVVVKGVVVLVALTRGVRRRHVHV